MILFRTLKEIELLLDYIEQEENVEPVDRVKRLFGTGTANRVDGSPGSCLEMVNNWSCPGTPHKNDEIIPLKTRLTREKTNHIIQPNEAKEKEAIDYSKTSKTTHKRKVE